MSSIPENRMNEKSQNVLLVIPASKWKEIQLPTKQLRMITTTNGTSVILSMNRILNSVNKYRGQCRKRWKIFYINKLSEMVCVMIGSDNKKNRDTKEQFKRSVMNYGYSLFTLLTFPTVLLNIHCCTVFRVLMKWFNWNANRIGKLSYTKVLE